METYPVNHNAEEIQRYDYKLRLLDSRLKHCQAKQYDLLQEEGQIRSDMQRIENEKYSLLKAG